MMKKILILSLLTFPLFGDIKQRLEKLEKEMGEVRIETPLANFGAAYAPGGPSLREGQKGWYATGEILYWNAKVGGTEYALSSGGQSTLPFAPTKGRVKGNSFGWKYGGRVGIGKVLMHDKWDAYLNFTYYQNHNSTSTEKKPPSFLLAQVGFFGGAYERAKSTYDLTYMNLDLEIGRESFVSRTLSFRPHIGLKATRLFQEQKVKFLFSQIQQGGRVHGEFYRVYNRCDSTGIGPRIGFEGTWHWGCGVAFESSFSTALLYTHFDPKEKEKSSPNASNVNTNIRLSGKLNKFIPFTQIFMGIAYRNTLLEQCYHITLKLGFEALYFWRENQCVQREDWIFSPGLPSTRLSYKRFAEDLSLYGLTLAGRLDF